jgi:hypothetical protein
VSNYQAEHVDRMKYVAQFAACFCILATSVQAQQIASVDLTRPQEPTKSAGTQAPPKGCEKLLPGIIADGFVAPPNHEAREILVEMAKLSDENPVAGSEVQGEVRLRNTGKYPITIPWSTDPSVLEKGQNPNNRQWEEGRFNISLKGGYDPLVKLSPPLLSSRFSAGSELTIQPDQWITAVVKFKLTPQYPLPGDSMRKGERELFVEWEQVGREQGLKDCAVSNGYFHYLNYYRQQNPTVRINVR